MAPTNNQCDLRNWSTANSCYQLGSILGNAIILGVLAHHEAGNILEKQDRDLALPAKLDEMCGFERGVTEENAVVRNYAYGQAVDFSKAAYHGFSESFFEPGGYLQEERT